MESQRYALKLFVQAPCEVPEKDFILFFHRLIQEAALGETTIDVTDYSHVPGGPGVMLICHEAHYSTDHAAGKLGLKVAAKRGATGDTATRLRAVTRRALRVCALMEAHEIFAGRIHFDTTTALFSIEDRLIAPNTAATFDTIAPILSEVASPLWGAPVTLARVGSAKECFQIALSAPTSPTVAEMLDRLS